MSRIDKLCWLIDKELESYNLVKDNLDKQSPDYQKYSYFIECLTTFKDKIIFSNFDFPSFIFQVLQENYGKYDTKLIFRNGNKLFIGKDEVWRFDNNQYIFLGEDDNPQKMNVGYNLDYVERFETLNNTKEEDVTNDTVEVEEE